MLPYMDVNKDRNKMLKKKLKKWRKYSFRVDSNPV